jgi:hypothetical protein
MNILHRNTNIKRGRFLQNAHHRENTAENPVKSTVRQKHHVKGQQRE